jgi:hypothetical protein
MSEAQTKAEIAAEIKSIREQEAAERQMAAGPDKYVFRDGEYVVDKAWRREHLAYADELKERLDELSEAFSRIP